MTHRIDRSEIEGLPVLAEGYKIFDDEWKCKDYCYADDNGVYIEACAEVLEWTGKEFFDYRHSFVGYTPDKAPFWMRIPDLSEVEE